MRAVIFVTHAAHLQTRAAQVQIGAVIFVTRAMHVQIDAMHVQIDAAQVQIDAVIFGVLPASVLDGGDGTVPRAA
jgi:hypothetical protein